MKRLLSLLLALSVYNAHSQKIFSGEHINRVAFPIGGMGAGMFCLEGTGAVSHMSVRNIPDLFNEPAMFAAIRIKGMKESARVLEGPVPQWKKFGQLESARGGEQATWGLARFLDATFQSRFPFGEVKLTDKQLPLSASITGWSPFIPTDADRSSMPLGALEYTFVNNSDKTTDYVFSYNSRNFMKVGDTGARISPVKNGFILSQQPIGDKKEIQGSFAIFTDQSSTIVDHCWFRGGWFDPLYMAWNHVESGETKAVDPVPGDAPGASLYVPFTLKPKEKKTIRVMMCWYVPETTMHEGWSAEASDDHIRYGNHHPWYSGKFRNIEEVAGYWSGNYDSLRRNTETFTNAFYRSTLPKEVTEAIAANLSILKSPTVLRQADGRFWAWEGCNDKSGSCPGSCTHVWNYAQALPHLFPAMERTMRETEFEVDQDEKGHQTFRAMIPIRPMKHDFYAASDGQLGGIMKVYRDWRISGDSAWLRKLYPKVRASIDYCIGVWDPRHVGMVEEPHHNTYDIEFWGPNGMTTSIYLGALQAFRAMSKYLNEPTGMYDSLLAKGKAAMESKLYNGEYFQQNIQWTGLSAGDPIEVAKKTFGGAYSPEAEELMRKEGPKYQYGKGCLSDGVLGEWFARVCGLPGSVDSVKVKSHLQSVYRYNFKKDLSNFSNPQRSTYALGTDGGLLLCTWPKGGKPSLPFVYSNEVWTGIEYQVASHLIFSGDIQKGLDIVRAARARYDGKVRNPYNEYECGHFYARALSSYSLIQAFTGVRYDAVTKTLYTNSRIGDFTSFISTASGFGNVTVKGGKTKLDVAYGTIDVKKFVNQ